jgi:hypothetical protein
MRAPPLSASGRRSTVARARVAASAPRAREHFF